MTSECTGPCAIVTTDRTPMRKNTARRFLFGGAVLLVLGVMVLSGWSGIWTGGVHGATAASPVGPLSASAVQPAAVPGSAHVAHASPLTSTPATSSVTYGKGTFFTSQTQPSVPTANQTCSYIYSAYSECYNDTTDPSLNLTTYGVLGLAYDMFTNSSPCPAMRNITTSTEIGFSVSTNMGASWSTPLTLGNPSCSGADANYSSAISPSLTSLPNGTLVLTYVEYNWSYTWCSYCYYAVPPAMYSSELSYDRIVLTESYNNGTTWTTPKVLDSTTSYSTTNYPDLRPWIAATGDTLYVTWMNMTGDISYYSICGGSAGISVIHSTDGGSTWSSVTNMKVEAGSTVYCSSDTHMAENPEVMVNPAGEVFVAYATNLSQQYQCFSYCSYFNYATVEVASSTDNASTFNYTDAATNVPLMGYTCCIYNSIFYAPFPTLAWNDLTGQLYLAYEAGQWGNFCSEGSYTYCYTNNGTEVLTVHFQNSSDNGMNWSAAHTLGTELIDPSGGPDNSLWHPSMAVDDAGVIHLQAAFLNDTVCTVLNYTYASYTYCGGHQEVYVTSSNDGASWSAPAFVYYYQTAAYGPEYIEDSWDGTFTSTISAGSAVILGWTQQQCPNLLTYGCYWGNAASTYAQVTTSELYLGVGLNITFAETGLPTGSAWSVSLQGNLRFGTAPATLSVSGVPPGQTVVYSAPFIQQGWGVQYQDTLSTPSPASFAANTTVTATYTEYDLLTIGAIPNFDSYLWQYYTNYQISPSPGASWVAKGSSLSASVTAVAPTYCYPCYNLSWVAWTGTGAGNVSTTSQSFSTTVNGPLNETASFRYIGYCESIYTGGLSCHNLTFPLNFTEKGLPAGVTWSVTWASNGGGFTTNSTTSSNIELNVSEGSVAFYLWSVPDPSSGDVWVPSSTVESPVFPMQGVVPITFTKELASQAEFPVQFVSEGLPTGTPWSVTVGGSSLGFQSNNSTVQMAGGGPFSVNGSFVYLQNGVGYYASSVEATYYVENSSTVSETTPAALWFNGSATVLVDFKPMYLLTTTASVGGTVSPPSYWVQGGASVTLGETPDAGYHFVGWTGIGSGSTTVAQDNQTAPTITPGGPVSEFATFRPNPLPTENLTIQGTGLPSGTQFSISLGSLSYSGSGSFLVGNLTNGNYTVSVPYVYLNSSETTRFVPSGVTSSLGFTAGGLLEVDANGTVTVAFTTQFLVTVASTPAYGGSISVAAGQSWMDNGSSLQVTATPAAGFYFVNWNGTGPTSVTQTAAALSLTVTGPVGETAQFMKRPLQPPATYWLKVTETNLPSTLTWNVSLGALGAGGMNATLQVVDLNGTYTLNIPAVYPSAGVRWVANVTSGESLTVSANGTLDVSFSEQFMVSVSSSAGGVATPGTSWVDAGSQVTFQATANATSKFVGWNGTGTGAYTGTDASTTITVSAPIQEVANFAPIVKPATPASNTSFVTGELPGILALVALLIVGLLVGLLMGRRRKRQPPVEAAEAPAPYSEGPAPTEPAPYDESSA